MDEIELRGGGERNGRWMYEMASKIPLRYYPMGRKGSRNLKPRYIHGVGAVEDQTGLIQIA